MTNLDTSVIQVTNVSPTSSLEQMTTFFSFVGPVSEVVIYPREDSNSIQTQSKTCYVRFNEPASVKVAQHLSNTVFIDRALIVTPVFDDRIPDECTSYSLTSGLNGCNNEGLVNQVVTGNNGLQVISTIDPRLSALGLPQYPGLPSNTDPSRIEEIRRTVQITNLNASVTGEDVLRFFNQIGEVKYVRMITNDNIPSRLTKLQIALVEFTEQSTVASALQSNGSILGSLPIKVSHCAQSIVKPYGSSRSSHNQQRDIEEAMRRVRDSQQLSIEQPGLIKLENILHLTNEHNKNIGPVVDRRSSRSRSRSKRSTSRTRRRSRSRDSHRRETYRSRYDRYDDRYDDRRRKSPRRSPRPRSRTPPTRVDREKYDDRRRHRSRSRESGYRRRHEDAAERTSSRRHRDRSRSPDRSHRHRERSREREHSRRERSPAASGRHRSGREQRETDPVVRREKAVREEDDNHLAMDQDLIPPPVSTRGPSTPPTLDFKFRKVAAPPPPPPPPPAEEHEKPTRRSVSHSPERRREHKHAKEKKKKKEKVRVSSSEESDRDSIDNGRAELMEH